MPSQPANGTITSRKHSQDLNQDSITTHSISKIMMVRHCVKCLLFSMIGIVMTAWKVSCYCVLILWVLFWYNGGPIYGSLLAGSVAGLLYYGQDFLLYYPEQPPNARTYIPMPSGNILASRYNSVMFKTADGTKINLFFIKCRSGNSLCPTMVYFHGNAGNIGHRMINAELIHNSCDINILLVEYRGYGRSEGSPFEQGLYMDAEAAVDYLLQRDDIDSSKIIVFGRSLGGAVAVYLASRPKYSHRICALILENTFTSLPDIARVLFSIAPIHFVPEFLYKNKYPSVDRIQRITMPTLFLSGQADNLIPPQMMKTLYEVCRSKMKEFVPIANGTHNESWIAPNYCDHINNFIKKVLQHQRGGRVQH